MQTVNKLDYIYRKLVVKAREQCNETVDITNEEYARLYQDEQESLVPSSDSEIPIPDLHDYSKEYLTFNAITSGELIIDTNDKQYIPNIFINGIKKYYDSNSYYYNSSNIFNWNINIGDKITINYKSISAQNHKNCYPELNFKYNLTGNIITVVESFYNNIQNFDKYDLSKIYTWKLYIKDFNLNCENINVFIPETLEFNIKDYSEYSDYL